MKIAEPMFWEFENIMKIFDFGNRSKTAIFLMATLAYHSAFYYFGGHIII
jgi:hypothetical protein